MDPITIALLASAGFKLLVDVGKWGYNKYQDYKKPKEDDDKGPAGVPVSVRVGDTDLTIITNNKGDTKVTVNSSDNSTNEHSLMGDLMLEASGAGRAFLAADIATSVIPHSKSEAVAEVRVHAGTKDDQATYVQVAPITTAAIVDKATVVATSEVKFGPVPEVTSAKEKDSSSSGVHHRKAHVAEKSKLHNNDAHHSSEEKVSWFSGFTSSFTEKLNAVVNIFERFSDKLSSHFHSNNSSCYYWDGYGTPSSIPAFNEYFGKQLPLGGSGNFLLPEGAEVYAAKDMQGVVTVTGATQDNAQNEHTSLIAIM